MLELIYDYINKNNYLLAAYKENSTVNYKLYTIANKLITEATTSFLAYKDSREILYDEDSFFSIRNKTNYCTFICRLKNAIAKINPIRTLSILGFTFFTLLLLFVGLKILFISMKTFSGLSTTIKDIITEISPSQPFKPKINRSSVSLEKNYDSQKIFA